MVMGVWKRWLNARLGFFFFFKIRLKNLNVVHASVGAYEIQQLELREL